MPNWKVRAGSDKLGNFPSLPVAKIFITEPNSTSPKEKDIALVKLQLPLTFSGERRPPCRQGGLRPWAYPLFKSSVCPLFPANMSASHH